MNPLHLSLTAEWFTPSDICRSAREVLQGIDLDPASCAEANATVQAARYLTRDQDGLTAPWRVGDDRVSVFINPPGGTRLPPAPGKKRGSGGMLPSLFWQRLMGFRDGGHLAHAIFVAYSLEQLQQTQIHVPSMMDFPVCVPRKRIRFSAPAGRKAASPTHANAIVYVPGTVDNSAAFRLYFEKYGKVR